MHEQLVLVCEHHHNDMVFFRYEWPRIPGAPSLLILETGTEALAFLRKCVETYGTAPCLVICELDLPEGGGLEVLRYMKSTPALHDVPVVVMSEILTRERCQEALELGAMDCWRKPISWESVRSVVEPMITHQPR